VVAASAAQTAAIRARLEHGPRRGLASANRAAAAETAHRRAPPQTDAQHATTHCS